MAKIEKRNIVAGFVSGIAGLAVPILAIMFLFDNYSLILKGFADAGKIPGVIMQDIHQPLFSGLLMLAGVLMLVGSVGYFYQKKWAFISAFIGSVITIFGGWMMAMFPMMVGLAPFHFSTFFIGAIVFLVLLVYVHKTEAKVWIMSLIFGISFVMTFMNGNAALNKMMGGNQMAKMQAATKGVPGPAAPHKAFAKMNVNDQLMFELVQQFLWVGAFAFLVVCIAVVYRKDWVWPVALGASIIAMAGGFPVAYADSIAQDHISQFFYGPVIGVIIFFALFIFKERLWAKDQPLFRKKAKA